MEERPGWSNQEHRGHLWVKFACDMGTVSDAPKQFQ